MRGGAGELLLRDAGVVIRGRRRAYGVPIDLFEQVARRWSLTLGTRIGPAQRPDPGGERRHVAGGGGRIRELRRDPVRLERLGANARRAYDETFNRDASLSAWVRRLEAVAAVPAPAPAPRLVPAA